MVVAAGSPPPMRGKALCETAAELGHRITPAYAGKSAGYQLQGCLQKDHPRLCGEKHHHSDCSGVRLGSPPPMRGKVAVTDENENPIRITPAYAGKSVACPSQGVFL